SQRTAATRETRPIAPMSPSTIPIPIEASVTQKVVQAGSRKNPENSRFRKTSKLKVANGAVSSTPRFGPALLRLADVARGQPPLLEQLVIGSVGFDRLERLLGGGEHLAVVLADRDPLGSGLQDRAHDLERVRLLLDLVRRDR